MAESIQVSPANPSATGTQPCLCCAIECGGEWEEIDVQSVDAFSDAVSWFDDEAAQPEGVYRLVYVQGTIDFANPFPCWWMGDFNSVAVWNDGANEKRVEFTARHCTPEEAELASAGSQIIFRHISGRIGVYLFDIYNDNVVGPTGPPTWRLERCVPGGGS